MANQCHNAYVEHRTLADDEWRVCTTIEVHSTHYEQEAEAVEDGVDAQHRLPVLPQNIEADVAL
jgi:hypothetical protein